jgi:putative ABC transport system substrate-binding protein
MPVIGFLHSASPVSYSSELDAFRQGLTQNGYVEGQNVEIEYRWAENQFDRLPAMAAELAQRRVSVMVAGGTRFRLWPQKRRRQQFQSSL